MGMGSLFAGFVKGASDYGVDQIRRRQDAEQEIEKQKLLEKLRLDTEKEMATFRDKLDSTDVDKGISSPDYARNKLVYRNKKGDVISERDLTPDEIQAHSLETNTAQASLDNTKSAIASRSHDDALQSERLALDRQRTAAEVGESNARTAKLKSEAGGLDGTKVLSKEYDRTVSDLAKSGVNPHQLAVFQTNWYEGVNSSKWTPSQQRVFLTEMRKRFTKPGGLMEKFNTGLESLDAKLQNSSP
jgi:hypothetical protein